MVGEGHWKEARLVSFRSREDNVVARLLEHPAIGGTPAAARYINTDRTDEPVQIDLLGTIICVATMSGH